MGLKVRTEKHPVTDGSLYGGRYQTGKVHKTKNFEQEDSGVRRHQTRFTLKLCFILDIFIERDDKQILRPNFK